MMQTNTNPVPVTRQSQITPEIAEALRTLRASDFQLESEFHIFDWETRLELAEELRQLLDDLGDAEADEIARVASDLEDEAEDFSTWDARTDAASRIRRVVRSIEKKEVAANA